MARQTSPRFSPSFAHDEMARFSALAGAWWDEKGSFKALHQLNPLRLEYVVQRLSARIKGRKAVPSKPLSGLKILDVGCGGGLLAEGLARLGAKVVAIDASEKAIEVAKAHAQKQGLSIDYRVACIEDMVAEGAFFDVVTAFEIVEHIANLPSFIKSLAQTVKPKGLLAAATLNRTTKSYLLAIVAAEYVLGWVPAGTHSWDRFVKPSEFVDHLAVNGLHLCDLTGVVFNPVSRDFSLHPHKLDVNYMLVAHKGK